jgi:heat-inducible transcriptional repressor
VADKLGERKHQVLVGAIEDFIKDASPITSGGVKERHIHDISTATLRNELSALEAMGYLKQVHTSGGRVPTILGYRYYVNELLKNINYDERALNDVKKVLEGRTKSLTEIISELAKLISQVVNYPTVIYMNGYDKLIIETMKIYPLVDKQALILIQTANGYITNTIDSSADLKSCEDASNYLTNKFSGKTIGEMLEALEQNQGEMIAEIENFKLIVDNLIEGLRKVLNSYDVNIRHEGSADLLDESGETSEQAKKVLKLLDNKEELVKAMELEKDQDDLTVMLVEEDKYSGCAMVKAPLCVNGQAVASIGVLGPQRMNYAGIASALKVVMSELNNRQTATKKMAKPRKN